MIPYSVDNSLVPLHSGTRCPYCRKVMNSSVMRQPTRDHIIPKAKGGSNAPCNIAIVCRRCNYDKADRYLSEFYAWLRGYDDPRYEVVRQLVENACAADRDLLAEFYASAGLYLVRIGQVPRRQRDRSSRIIDVAWSTMERLKVPKTHWSFAPPDAVKILARSQIHTVPCTDPHRFADRVCDLLGVPA